MQELLKPKEGWEVKKLGEIAEIKTGKKNNEDKVTEGKYPFFVRSQQLEQIDTYSFDGEAILMPGEGNIGSIFHYINGKFDYHQRVYKISDFSKDFFGKYIYYCMFQNFNQHAMKNSVKATVDSLRLPTFQQFEFYSPSHPEQQAIAQILSDMDAEIEALEQKRDKYKMLKQGMMQELLTGKTRLV
jgi:type I restriction enzyme S subunit